MTVDNSELLSPSVTMLFKCCKQSVTSDMLSVNCVTWWTTTHVALCSSLRELLNICDSVFMPDFITSCTWYTCHKSFSHLFSVSVSRNPHSMAKFQGVSGGLIQPPAVLAPSDTVKKLANQTEVSESKIMSYVLLEFYLLY